MSEEEQLLLIREVCERVRFSRAKIYRYVKRGRFPKPMKAGRSALWRASDISAWIRALEPAP